MISHAVAFAVLLHVFFWGVGLSILVMPGQWRRFWPVLVLPAGFALQSLVVWLGAHAGLSGTRSYALMSEAIPLVLLAVGLWRVGVHRLWIDLGRFGLVWATMAVSLALLVLPLAIASRGLTTISLGSCDAADYAAGARVFMDFARSDRTGFLGLTEVVQVMSVDNFFDFWLRLNHFTPSALMALNGSILDCAPHELASLFTMVVLASTVPLVFWIARALFGYSGVASLIIGAVYGISPITWYSVAHVSPAPLLAGIAIGLMTWAAVGLWHGRLTWRRGAQFAGVLAISYTIILGSYNFILLVGFVPALGYAGTRALAKGAWRRLVRWVLILAVPFVFCGFVMWTRVAGLLERFMLFRTYDFGWRIPVLTPEGWLGMVSGGDLSAWSWGGTRWALSVVIVAILTWAIVRGIRTKSQRLWVVASVAIPVLAGYAFLQIRGYVSNTNASYDAFKLFTVFYPLLLPAFCWWITLRWNSRLLYWFGVAAVAAVVIGFNLIGCAMFVFKLSRPPLIVDGELRQIRRIEAMPDVKSVNMLIPDMWSRLWANAFLLRKQQYFETHTYEGRLNTALKGDWDLGLGIVRAGPAGEATRIVAPHVALVDRRHPLYLRASLLAGWHAPEQTTKGERWCWTRGDASLAIENAQSRPLLVRITLDARSLTARQVAVTTNGSAPTAPRTVGEPREKATFDLVRVPPGRSVLTLDSTEPPTVVEGDSRPLGLCVYSLTIEAVE